MSWTDITGFYSNTADFFSKVYDIIMLMLAAMARATKYLDGIDFNQSIFVSYLGYFRYVVGDIAYIAMITAAQIALGITLWKLLLRGVGLIKHLLPW